MEEINYVPLIICEAANGKKEPMHVQSVIVKKGEGCASAISEAKGKVPEGMKTEKVDETDSSFRFRQMEPSLFDEGTFRSKEVNSCVTLVLGKIK